MYKKFSFFTYSVNFSISHVSMRRRHAIHVFIFIKFQLVLLAICAGRATTILSSSKIHPSSLPEIPTSTRFIRSHMQHRLVLRTVRNIRISICPLPPYIILAIEFLLSQDFWYPMSLYCCSQNRTLTVLK